MLLRGSKKVEKRNKGASASATTTSAASAMTDHNQGVICVKPNNAMLYRDVKHPRHLVHAAFQTVRKNGAGNHVVNTWSSAQAWVDAINETTTCFSPPLDTRTFNRTLSCVYPQINQFDRNMHGVFRWGYQKKWYYYVTREIPAEDKPLSLEFPTLRIHRTDWARGIETREAQHQQERTSRSLVGKVLVEHRKHQQQQAQEAAAAAAVATAQGGDANSNNPGTAAAQKQPPAVEEEEDEELQLEPRSVQLIKLTYWDSTEAHTLFNPKPTDASVVDCLQRRMTLLQKVKTTVDGWRDVLDDKDVDNHCTPQDILTLRLRCELLCMAYHFALTDLGKAGVLKNGGQRCSWADVCRKAIETLRPVGKPPTKHPGAVRSWNRHFRQAEVFPNIARERNKNNNKTNKRDQTEQANANEAEGNNAASVADGGEQAQQEEERPQKYARTNDNAPNDVTREQSKQQCGKDDDYNNNEETHQAHEEDNAGIALERERQEQESETLYATAPRGGEKQSKRRSSNHYEARCPAAHDEDNNEVVVEVEVEQQEEEPHETYARTREEEQEQEHEQFYPRMDDFNSFHHYNIGLQHNPFQPSNNNPLQLHNPNAFQHNNHPNPFQHNNNNHTFHIPNPFNNNSRLPFNHTMFPF